MRLSRFGKVCRRFCTIWGRKTGRCLEKREALQGQIDAWHIANRDKPHDHETYKAFLEEIGYLLPEGGDFEVETANVDPEIASVPGPQLVVPITNARLRAERGECAVGVAL